LLIRNKLLGYDFKILKAREARTRGTSSYPFCKQCY